MGNRRYVTVWAETQKKKKLEEAGAIARIILKWCEHVDWIHLALVNAVKSLRVPFPEQL
jgi:hypothetical protein